MTRIVAGSAKGRPLKVPAKGTRPTSERVREALFSRLEHFGLLNEANVLDLYAGSGALGLEAASRGAARVDIVDKAVPVARIIAENIATTRLNAAVHTRDVLSFLSVKTGEALRGDVDLVLIDPPYDLPEEQLGSVLCALGPWIGPDSLVVVERSTRSPEPRWPDFLVLEDDRRWGQTRVWFAEPPVADS